MDGGWWMTERDSPRSGRVWKEMTGTRARWMTWTCAATWLWRMSAESWNSVRFFVSGSSYDSGIVTTMSVSLYARRFNHLGQ